MREYYARLLPNAMRSYYFICLLSVSIVLSGCAPSNSAAPAETNIAATENVETITEHTEAAYPPAVQQISDYGITITEMKESPSFSSETDPSVTLVKTSISYPQIAIEGSPEAAEKIQNAIETELSTFRNFEKENASAAQEAYLLSLDDPELSFSAYTAEFSYEIKRCDDKIISIVFSQYDLNGGAHGNFWSYGMTFDTATGEKIFLESLSSDSAAFSKMILNELNEQAALPAYQDFLYADMPVSIEDALLADNSTCWYLDRSGISFISNPYVLGSYAAGAFEFNIPYQDLTSLKEEYFYEGSYIRKLFPGISVQYDLNGDGEDDSICYSIVSEDGFTNAQPHLTVNSIDFSETFNSLYLTYLWTGAYYLIDVDVEDPYVEIAVSNENPDHPDDTCTHFFRFNENGQLVYQGSVSGIFNEDMQIRYNENGNLTLYGRNGEPLS